MIAVLAGDIIKSSRLTPEELQNVKDCIANTCDELREKFPHFGLSQLFFFRGDGWQMVIQKPSASLHVALSIYAALRHQNIAQTRIAIGVGNYDVLDMDSLDKSSGSVFSEVGHTLDNMTSRSRDIVFARRDFEKETAIRVGLWGITSCVSAIASDWTSRQAQIAYIAMQRVDETRASLAEILDPPITPQAFTDSLVSSHFAALSDGISAYFTILE
ncbi:hypothetical protein [Hirschia litorea]|uniref:SatD family (SatD) n=1 Tax=Hirschia litorea TaxID=1199156 RepID=A0ABW2IJ11_9PROT